MVALSRNVARKAAMEMLFTGETVEAEEARRIGLVNRVVAPEILQGETMALAAKIAAKPRFTVQDRQGSLLSPARDAAGRGLRLCLPGDDREHAGCGSQRRHQRVPGKAGGEMAELALPEYPDTLIKSILRSVKTIAMVGASGNDIRPSYFAMMYLLNKGYKIIPVNPGMAGKEILGQKVYASLKEVPAPVDMVDIFREAKYAPEIAREAVAEKDRLGLKVMWMQLGVISEEAEKIGKDAGLTVVMDRCPKIEHGRFSGEIGWMGVNRKVIDNRKPLLFGRGGTLKHG